MNKTDVVVIGAGALGASTAFHLATAGRHVTLLDQAAVGSQTSARAAGLSGQLRATQRMTDLAVRAVRKIERFTEETGQPMVYVQPGSITIARRPQDAAQIAQRVALGQRMGLDIDFITPEHAAALMPSLHPPGILAACHMRTDVYLEPTQLAIGYARAAEQRGAVVLPHTQVVGLRRMEGRVTHVETDRGPIEAAAVVDAAGGWVRHVADMAGAPLPVITLRTQVMTTVPLPEVSANQPIVRIIDANVCIRPDRGGLMLGGYEADPKVYDMARMPRDFRIENLDLDLPVMRRLAAAVADQFPVFRDVALQDHRGGLPTMTMDGQYVVGPVPGVDGLFVIGGCNVGGLSIAPALGEALAAWLTTGRQPDALAGMSPDRFATSLTDTALRDICVQNYARSYSHRWDALADV